MNLEIITPHAYALELGLIQDDGEISKRGLAELLRAPLARWGLSSRMSVMRYAREQLRAACVFDQAGQLVENVLNDLIRLGECEQVAIGHETCIAPARPRWLRISHETGALLDVSPVPEGIEELPGADADIVRRISVRNDDDLDRLHMAGVREISFRDWLRPPGYLAHAGRRMDRPIRSDQMSLPKFWDLLKAALENEGQPLGNEAVVRAVTGEPGGFFGDLHAETPNGRWSDSVPDGLWCARRRGYLDQHWHPVIMQVNGGERRILDLYDMDEWRWALIAKGRRLGPEEPIRRLEGEVRLDFPAPDQLVGAMDLLGARRSAWSWQVQAGAPDPWQLLE